MIIKCLAIDDEPLALNIIKKYAADIPHLDLLDTCPDALLGLAFIKEKPVDLILLDINMPKLSGISFIKSLKQPPLVVFTTAYPDHAIEGFELEAVDYLLKPFSFERFYKAIQKVEEQLTFISNAFPKQDYIFIKADRKFHKLSLDDILRLEAYGDYVKVFTIDKMILTKQKLSQLYAEMPKSKFVQIHRSHIISIKQIEYLEGNIVSVAGNKLPISVGYRELVFSSLIK